MPYADVPGGRLWFDTTGEGPDVLLVHSGMSDSRMWDRHVGPLSEQFRVIRTDLRFFGRSRTDEVPFSFSDDLVAVLDAAGVDGAAVVALSFGGRVALDFALERPERVRALVLASPGLTGRAFSPYDVEREAAVEKAFAAGDFDRSTALELEVWAPLGATPEMHRLAVENAHVDSVEAEPAWPEPPTSDRLGEIGTPTLVLNGDRDVPGMLKIGETLERQLPGARRIVLPGVDHFVPLREPERFVDEVVRFLAAPDPRSASPASGR